MILPTAEMLTLNPDDRFDLLFSDEDIKKFDDLFPGGKQEVKRMLSEFVQLDEAAIVVFEKLITVDELHEFYWIALTTNLEPMGFVLFDRDHNGITALREKLITLHEVNAMAGDEIEHLFSGDISLLRKRKKFLMDANSWKEEGIRDKEAFEVRFKALSGEHKVLVIRGLASLATAETLQGNPEDRLVPLLSKAQLEYSLEDINFLEAHLSAHAKKMFAVVLIENLASIKEMKELYLLTGQITSELVLALREGLMKMPEFLHSPIDYFKLLSNNLSLLRSRHQFITDPNHWKSSGVDSMEEFQTRFKALPLEYQKEIIENDMTFNIAERMLQRKACLESLDEFALRILTPSIQEQKELLLAPPDKFQELLMSKLEKQNRELKLPVLPKAEASTVEMPKKEF